MSSYLVACTSWRIQQVAPSNAAQLRITIADGRRLVVRDPQVIGDSLIGFTAPQSLSPVPPTRIAVRIGDVQRLERRTVDPAKTSLAVLGLGALIGLVVALSNLQTTDPYH